MENLIAGLFGLALGVVGLWASFRAFRNRAVLDHWLTTAGRVIERGSYQPDQPMLSAPAFRYSPLVKYRYEVNSKQFVSQAILPRRIQAPRHSTKQWAESQANSFPEEVVVHYNPEDPGESYLINASKGTLYLVCLASIVVMLVGVLFVLSWIM